METNSKKINKSEELIIIIMIVIMNMHTERWLGMYKSFRDNTKMMQSVYREANCRTYWYKIYKLAGLGGACF